MALSGATLRTAAVAVALAMSAGEVSGQDAALDERLHRADAAYAAQDYGAAAARLDRLIDDHPRDVPPAAYAKRASIFLVTGRAADGLAWIERVADRVYPDDPLVAAQRAQLLWQLGRRTDAALIAEVVVAQRPDEYPVHLLLGDFYLQRPGSAARAAVSYRAYLASRPAHAAQLDKHVGIKLGFALLLAGDAAAADPHFLAALSAPGDGRLDVLARRGRCAAAAELRRWRAAVAACERAVADGGDVPDPASLRHLARALAASGDLERALAMAARHVQAARSAAAYVVLGDVLARARAWDRAESQYRRALLLDPAHREALHRLGRLALRRQPPDPAESVARLETARQAHPADAHIAYDLGRAHLAAGDAAAAAASAERGLGLEPERPVRRARLLIVRGDAELLAGDAARAAQSFEQASSLVARGPVAARAAEGLGRASRALAAAAVADENLALAEQLLRRGARGAPRDVALARDLGIVLIEQGDAPGAIEALEQAVTAAPDDVLSHRLLARALAEAGDPRAAASYDQAIERARAAGQRALGAELVIERGALALRGGDHDLAVALLEAADIDAASDAFRARAAGALASARCRRGVAHLGADRGADALADLNAVGDALAGEEAPACRFALGLAHLTAGSATQAAAMLEARPARGDDSWLAAPWAGAEGAALLGAYADYRAGDPRRLSAAAAALAPLTRGDGPRASEARALLGAVHEAHAHAHAEAGRDAAAARSLTAALRTSADTRRGALLHNRVVLQMRRAARPERHRGELEALGGDPPEALVNLGVLADRAGDGPGAHRAWVEAQRRGASDRALRDWIARKKEIFGL